MPHSGGEAITSDQRYLVVTGGDGASVFDVAALEKGPASPLGRLASPGQQHAVEVAITPDDRYVFVTYQNSSHVGVFDLRRALQSGFSTASRVGLIPVGTRPIGVAVSPDGRYAYVASGRYGAPYRGMPGLLSVIDVRRAARDPATAVVGKVPAGCLPTRVLPSPDGRHLWVTEGGANAVLVFSVPKLLSDARHALLGYVRVGQYPLGLALARHGTRLVVADSNEDRLAAATSTLAVVDTAKLLAGKPSLIGYLPSGTTPKQFALSPDGHTLLVTDRDSGQIESFDLGHLR
jgi:DNA-binding beta-propeller fold protein YncE